MRKFFVIYIMALSVFLISAYSCGFLKQKEIGKQDMLDMYAQVKGCMGISQEVPPPTVTIIPNADRVQCGEFQRRGCYTSGNMTIILPENSDITTIRHEFVHHLLFVTTGDPDNNHTSPYFLKCSGLITE